MENQHVQDQLDIAALLARYARAVDTEDWDLWRSLFTDDATVDYTSAGGIVGSRNDVAQWLADSLALLPMKMHYITNIESEITSDTARVRAMFLNPMQLPGVSGLSCCGGYYHHVLIRTEQGWRSTELREENIFFTNPLPDADAVATN